MKKIFFALAILLFLSGCVMRIAEVPPRVYSLESAVQIPSGKYALLHLESVSGYEDIELKGMVAVYEGPDGSMYLLYGFKSFDDEPKKAWKSIVKKYGVWNLGVYIDLPSVGYYSVEKKGKHVVAWWKDVWLFVVESKGNPRGFVKDTMDAFARLGGMLR
ncbi:MAG: Uncharacterized protein XD58_1368 [Thermotoga sp. 50_1627]|uniref:DUF3242 domain-containing protein n=1 Tax=Pseudothermotoga sp. TaxID=2033661 RepID=UPI00076DED6A|nr:MAG: Uncharacterized protein XD45_1403 [Thermotoga sp. 50_64]KUK24634.1 MAG: Uncharacterized protein XD58_1368 [Thermotoga sp. 50_1627]MBC7117252.1 DUF3242 domain-containing protein [Pseudothermotoga sp.]HBT39554.1 DUF3242 domain-containing protein [Pseudothermotoga sp.]HCO98377.1 DUF3242 domain-containing protein [Pseudothermotoga sp.]